MGIPAITSGLRELNEADAETARELLRACCASSRWVSAVLARRPFNSPQALYEAATLAEHDLDEEDWLEAFAAHPRIGDRPTAATPDDRHARWSSGEQAGAAHADEQVLARLAHVNDEYHERFGFVYLVCATGRTAPEMLRLAEERLANSREEELCNAAGEQQKITQLRLQKLIFEPSGEAQR